MERKKKKKRNKILCNFKVCGGNFPEISFLAGSTVQKSEKRSTAWVPLGVRAPKEEWRKVQIAHSCHFCLSYFVLSYNALCDCEKKIICSIIFCHCHFNWLFTAVEMAECIVSLCGKGENYQSAAFLGTHTVCFLFCKLSAWGCSVGQEGGSFLTCHSYELLRNCLYSLLEGDYSSLASTFPQKFT